MTRRLENKTALVTGSTSNIGREDAGASPAHTPRAQAEETFDRVYAVNVKSAFFLTQAVAPAMISAGGGAIVNLGSWVARLGLPVGGLYSSTKGAVETLTRAWAAEFGPLGIRVNAISPGVILPPDWDPATEYPRAVFMRGAPASAPGNPEAIAAAAVYLASDEAAFTHGAVLDIDGGRANVLTPAAAVQP